MIDDSSPNQEATSLFDNVSPLTVVLTAFSLVFVLHIALPFLGSVVPNQFGRVLLGWSVCLIGGPWLLLRNQPGGFVRTLRFRSLTAGQSSWLVLIAVGVPFVFEGLGRVNQRFVPFSSEFEDQMSSLVPLTGVDWSFAILGLALAAPVGEEIVFRGLIQQAMRQRAPVTWAVLFCGAVFAAFHFLPAAALPLAALGVVLGLVYEFTGSLWAPILIHVLYNGFVLVHQAFWYDPNATESLPWAWFAGGTALVAGGIVQLHRGSAGQGIAPEAHGGS